MIVLVLWPASYYIQKLREVDICCREKFTMSLSFTSLDLFDVDGLDRLWHRQRGQLQNRHRRRRLLQRQRNELGSHWSMESYGTLCTLRWVARRFVPLSSIRKSPPYLLISGPDGNPLAVVAPPAAGQGEDFFSPIDPSQEPLQPQHPRPFHPKHSHSVRCDIELFWPPCVFWLARFWYT